MTERNGATLKEEVLAVLPEAYPEEAQHLLEVLALGGVEVTREAAPALVMMDARDCFGAAFHFGEVLVTTAGVRRGDREGYGLIAGDEPAKAMLLALLDALDTGEEARARRRLAHHLERLARRAGLARERAARLTGSTRVDFRSMAAD